MKTIKVPGDLAKKVTTDNVLALADVSIVESCTVAHNIKKTLFLQDHLLLFVLDGMYHIKLGAQHMEVAKHEMILLPKYHYIEIVKNGNPDNNYNFDSLMFFLKDDLLLEFLRMEKISLYKNQETAPILVYPFKERMLKYLESIKPYFREPEEINPNLFRIKMMELLYDLVSIDKKLLLQLVQLKNRSSNELPVVMDHNYLNPMKLSELAYLSGRSLSSFRRDFEKIYGISPARWIQEKRMEKAKELLSSTQMNINEICYHIGYENVSHFSKLYKEYWGSSPSKNRY